MSLESIINKIQTESRAESEAILSKAKAQARALQDEARNKAETAKKTALAKGRQEAERLEQRLLQSAELNARKQLLQLKQSSMEKVFNHALDKLAQLPPHKYQEMVKQMLLAQPLAGDEQVVVSEEDFQVLGNGFKSKVNQSLAAKGLKGQLEIVFDEKVPRGGFILRRDMVESNNTFASLLRAKRDELELAVAEVLFGDKA